MKSNRSKLLHQFMCILLAFVMAFGFAACNINAGKTDDHWYYTKSEWKDIQPINATLTEADKSQINVKLKDDQFTSANAENNVLLLDKSNFEEEIKNYDKDYVDQNLLKKCALSYEKVEVSEDKTTLTVVIDSALKQQLCLLIHKDLLVSNQTRLVEVERPGANGMLGAESDYYEKNYSKSKTNYNKGVQAGVNILSGIASIIAGYSSGNPAPIVSGVTSIFNGILGPTVSSGDSIKDVLNKLDVIDQKISRLNDTIERNHAQLMDETVMTQALVYRALLQDAETNIDNFHTKYFDVYNDHSRNLSDYVAQKFREFVKAQSGQDITIEFYKENGELYPLLKMQGDKAIAEKISFHVSSFETSNAFLKSHSDIVSEGFNEAFDQDIAVAVKDLKLPNGIDKGSLVAYVNSVLNEQFVQEYYVNDHKAATDLINLVVNASQHIYGKSGYGFARAIYDRLQFMYNFAGEVKSTFETVTVYYLNLMDRMVADTVIASMFAHVDFSNMCVEAQKARDTIQSVNEELQNKSNSYSFILQNNVSCTLYQASANTTYSGSRNKAKLNASYIFTRITSNNNSVNREGVDPGTFYSLNKLSAGDNGRIATRMELLQKLGVTEQCDYLTYLAKNGILSGNMLKYYLNDLNGTPDYKIATSSVVRDLNAGDEGLKLTCSARGNAKSDDYFSVGSTATYRGQYEKDCWSGNVCTTQFVSGITGKNVQDGILCGYASYQEGHWYWFDDEFWAFSVNVPNPYFFLLTVVN